LSRAERELVQRFWSALPTRALWPLLLAVFCTFSAMGFLVDVGGGARMDPRLLASIVAFSGLVAVAFAWIGMRRRYWLFAPVVVLQVLLPRWLGRVWPELPPREPAAWHARLQLDAAGAVAGLALGYGFFMLFIVRQGLRRVRADAEMQLAREIHASLVPELSLAAPGCELYGRSIPASEVGGDLVDGLLVDGRPLACVADVSGHGVPAGTLLGLLKAGVRTRLRTAGDPGAVLADVNDVLCELTRPNTFATAAMLSLAADGSVAYALAGHPPILHARRAERRVVRLGLGGMALGIRPGERYPVGRAELAPGDVLAVLTDGFSETMDGNDRELGLAPLEATLVAELDAPLPVLFERLLAVAGAHGPQQDDRTLLLWRASRASEAAAHSR